MGGASGTSPFVKWLNTGEFSSNITVFADNGAAAGMVANWMAYWVRQTSIPGGEEVDVAKAAISNDQERSHVLLRAGCTAPFTDLGLSTGLTSGGNPVTGSSTVAANVGPYPIYSRKIGVPNPTIPPSGSAVPGSRGLQCGHADRDV